MLHQYDTGNAVFMNRLRIHFPHILCIYDFHKLPPHAFVTYIIIAIKKNCMEMIKGSVNIKECFICEFFIFFRFETVVMRRMLRYNSKRLIKNL